MSLFNAQIWVIISTDYQNDQEEQAFKTPEGIKDTLTGIRDVAPKKAEKSRLRRKNLEKSFWQSEAAGYERKDRSPE